MQRNYPLLLASVVMVPVAAAAFFVWDAEPQREKTQVGSTDFLSAQNYWGHVPPAEISPEERSLVLRPWTPEEPRETTAERHELIRRVATSHAEAIVLDERCEPSPLVYHALPDTSVWFRNEGPETRTLRLLDSGEQVRVASREREKLSLEGRAMGGVLYGCGEGEDPVGLIWISL